MKSILIVQFRTDVSFLMERMCFYTSLLKKFDMHLEIVNALDKDISWNNPPKFINGHSAIILGGSAELYFTGNGDKKSQKIHDDMVGHARSLAEYLMKKDIPTLGICFGHQLLGSMLGGEIARDSKQAKTGSFEIELTEEGKKDQLLRGFPEKFLVHYGHKDSLLRLPKGATLLARGKRCKVSAFRYKKNVYGVQFHPEMSMQDIVSRVRVASEYVPGGKDAAELFSESDMAQKILESFVERVAVGEIDE